jgi:Tfp pilus assembly protein PilO
MADAKTKKTKLSLSKLNFMDFIIPLVSSMIFLLVIIFVLIPSIQGSRDMSLEIEEVKRDQELLTKNKDLIQAIDFNALQKDLSNAKRILPTKLEVAQFAYYVDSLAEEKGLRFRELKASDITIATEESVMLEMKGIRIPMGYMGDYASIVSFFDELQVASPYVISFGTHVELTKSVGASLTDVIWVLEIDVTGYYVEESAEKEDTANLYLPFLPYDRHEDMISEFDARVKKLLD